MQSLCRNDDGSADGVYNEVGQGEIKEKEIIVDEFKIGKERLKVILVFVNGDMQDKLKDIRDVMTKYKEEVQFKIG